MKINRFKETIIAGSVSIVSGIVYVLTNVEVFGIISLLLFIWSWWTFIEGVVVHWMFKHD